MMGRGVGLLVGLFAGTVCLPAAAQDMMGQRASLFDLGIYAGGAYHTDWFTTPEADGDEGWAPDFGAIFGAQATYWTSPSFGIRLQGAYLPSTLPQNEGAGEIGNFDMSSWLYDLDLVYRPFFYSSPAGGSSFLSSTYVFLGGGIISNDVGVNLPEGGCLPATPYLSAGVCVQNGTSFQGNLGAGLNLGNLGNNLGYYTEFGVHGFKMPGDVESGSGAEIKYAFAPRLSLGLRTTIDRGTLAVRGDTSYLGSIRFGAGLATGLGDLGEGTGLGFTLRGVGELADSALRFRPRATLSFTHLTGAEGGNGVSIVWAQVGGAIPLRASSGPYLLVGGGPAFHRSACGGCEFNFDLGLGAAIEAPVDVPRVGTVNFSAGINKVGDNLFASFLAEPRTFGITGRFRF